MDLLLEAKRQKQRAAGETWFVTLNFSTEAYLFEHVSTFIVRTWHIGADSSLDWWDQAHYVFLHPEVRIYPYRKKHIQMFFQVFYLCGWGNVPVWFIQILMFSFSCKTIKIKCCFGSHERLCTLTILTVQKVSECLFLVVISSSLFWLGTAAQMSRFPPLLHFMLQPLPHRHKKMQTLSDNAVIAVLSHFYKSSNE